MDTRDFPAITCTSGRFANCRHEVKSPISKVEIGTNAFLTCRIGLLVVTNRTLIEKWRSYWASPTSSMLVRTPSIRSAGHKCGNWGMLDQTNRFTQDLTAGRYVTMYRPRWGGGLQLRQQRGSPSPGQSHWDKWPVKTLTCRTMMTRRADFQSSAATSHTD
eukprot:755086-Hanusia_phi.AAC.8